MLENGMLVVAAFTLLSRFEFCTESVVGNPVD